MNSRLDTLQAAILQVKLKAFQEFELEVVNKVATRYTQNLEGFVQLPTVRTGYYSSWAQYSILLENEAERNGLQTFLREHGIPSMIYYPKPMHEQGAFQGTDCVKVELPIATKICKKILSLPLHPYMEPQEQDKVIFCIKEFGNL